ncbi:MAG: hypothetical protein GX640_17340 [Fibrobacter sp.]|nr:hypothetical protein [Fibrobacter sp.]
MRSLFYFVKEAFRGLYQAKLMTSASIISVASSLFFICIVGLSLFNIRLFIKNSADQADFAAYLTESISDDEDLCIDLLKKVQNIEQVQKVVLISKDSAWERFSKLYGNELLESVDQNPLPAALEIYLKEQFQNEQGANALEQILRQYSGIEQVRYSRDYIVKFERFRMIFGLVSVAFILIMIVVLIFMVSNSVKLTIYARKELVRNMGLVGATRFFITMPFILEGMLQGFLGGLLCIFFMCVIRFLVRIPIPISWGPDYFFIFILFTGVVFGWIGSQSAVRKFLS